MKTYTEEMNNLAERARILQGLVKGQADQRYPEYRSIIMFRATVVRMCEQFANANKHASIEDRPIYNATWDAIHSASKAVDALMMTIADLGGATYLEGRPS